MLHESYLAFLKLRGSNALFHYCKGDFTVTVRRIHMSKIDSINEQGPKNIIKVLTLASLGLVFILSVLSIVENFNEIIVITGFPDFFPPELVPSHVLGVVITCVLPILCIILGLIAFMKKTNLFYLASIISLCLIVLLSWILSIVSYSSWGGFRGVESLLLGVSSAPYLVFNDDDFYWIDFGYPPPLQGFIVEISLLVSVIVAIILSAVGLAATRSAKLDLTSAEKNVGANMSFIRLLFDVSFDNFIYVKFSKFLYLASIILHGLVGLVFLGFLIYNLSYTIVDPVLSLLMLPLVFLGLFISLILIRLGLETGVALIKIAENTKRR